MPSFDWLGSLLGGAAGYLGSRGDDNSTTETRSIPPEFANLAAGVGSRGVDILNQPYEPFPEARYAPPAPDTFAGWDMTRNWATGNQLPQQASDSLSNMLRSGGGMAPQSANPYMGASASVGSNPWENRTTSVGTNPYAGSNPYLEQNIQRTLDDTTRSYNQNVAPTMAANAYQSGSFGNTGQQEMENESRNMLQRNLGSISGNMRMQDYGMQQGLAESDIARRMNAQQTDLARSAGIAEGGLNRSLQGSLADLGRNAGLYESGANRASSDWNSAQGRMLSGLNMAPSTYGMGFQAGNALGGIGTGMTGYANQQLGGDYEQYLDARNWPTQQYNTARGVFGGVNAGGTSTTQGPQSNPWAGFLGGAGLGNTIFGPQP